MQNITGTIVDKLFEKKFQLIFGFIFEIISWGFLTEHANCPTLTLILSFFTFRDNTLDYLEKLDKIVNRQTKFMELVLLKMTKLYLFITKENLVGYYVRK